MSYAYTDKKHMHWIFPKGVQIKLKNITKWILNFAKAKNYIL